MNGRELRSAIEGPAGRAVAVVRADDLETAVLALILQRFRYRVIASTSSGLVVLRLGARRP